ncbi:FMN-binding protein [Streptomyces sp. Q6]|uniref:FMN-binding protein n=1 Tax=Streptomyces citrinus TaxID=3118173 RepID=A0ACD5A885_9ACTN
MKSHALRRTVLTCAATVTVPVLALALKPHTAPSGAVGSGAVPAPSASPSGSSSAGGGSSSGTSTSRTVTGDVVQTRYGPMQVEITLEGSKITAARAVQSPSGDPRSQQINASAVPTLVQETLDAQSARLDSVSGATFTSEGYMSSLQSALDQAHG